MYILFVNNRIRWGTLTLIGFFLVQTLSAPTTSVIASTSTNFDIGSRFTYTMNNFNLSVALDGIDVVDSSNYSLFSIGEPMDLTITDVVILDLVTSESSIAATLDFQNPDNADPTGEFFTNSLSWGESVFKGYLTGFTLVDGFDPTTAIFLDPFLTEDLFLADPVTQPVNGSLLFPNEGGQIVMSFLVDKNESKPLDLYDTYVENWNQYNLAGIPDDGYYNTTIMTDIIGSDETNYTEWNGERVVWNNITKIFESRWITGQSYVGTFNSGSLYNARWNYSMSIIIDYGIGAIIYYDQQLEVEYNVIDSSYFLVYDFGYTEESYIPPVPETSSSETTTSNTRTIATSTSETTISRTTTTSNTSSTTDITSSGSNGTEESPNPEINYSTPQMIAFSLLIIRIIYLKRKNR